MKIDRNIGNITKQSRQAGQFPTSVLILLSILYFGMTACSEIDSQQIEFSGPEKKFSSAKYDVDQLDDSQENIIIKYGHDVFVNSAKYLGAQKISEGPAYAGNNLSCGNCHLWSGTKPFAAPLIGIIQRFPQYRGREDKIGNIVERINGCMERSMNGNTMPDDAPEMSALVAYLSWLSRDAPDDGKVNGQGFVRIEIPERAVNLKNGQQVFASHCVVCHGMHGQGLKSQEGYSYQYPPLWGSDSFNTGAGMNRVITAAQFIKANMPFGSTAENPILTDEQAYDVAGFINQQNRPEKLNREKDFPDLRKKPMSTPYPPYSDTFSIAQHQLGPFQPIMKYYEEAYNIIKSK